MYLVFCIALLDHPSDLEADANSGDVDQDE
jgi:hypothetical protein